MQVTAFDLSKQREADKRQAQDAAAQRDMAQKREVGQADYDRLVTAQNDNAVDGVDARDVDSALAQLSVGEECASCQPSDFPMHGGCILQARASVCAVKAAHARPYALNSIYLQRTALHILRVSM
jgi:hypothetical protein